MRLVQAIALGLSGLAMSSVSLASVEKAETASSAAALESYIVKFGETGVLHYAGDLPGMRATRPQSTGLRKLDAKSPASLAYRDYLRGIRETRLVEISSAIARPVSAAHDYDIMFHGVALDLTAAEAQRLRSVPGVISVELGGTYELDTDAGPALIGAPNVWNGSAVPGGAAVRGENVVVGIIDSGSNADHPSFANNIDLTCGFTEVSPKLISTKDCLEANCVGGNPEDSDPSGTGHGVHTASTAAGNALATPLTVAGVELLMPISGVAPCAKVRTYKVCATNSCSGTAIADAIEEAIIDQVDVLNYSISGGRTPWADADRSFLDAINADIFVAASAGNTNTTITNPVGQVNHRGPWMMSVANSTHDRVVAYDLDVAGSLQNVPAQPGNGVAYPNGATSATITSAASLGNEIGCTAGGGFPAASLTGRIALISRGTCTFVEKINNASAAGATAVIVYNNAGGPPTVMSATGTTIPSAMIAQGSGVAIRDFLASNPATGATVTAPAARITDPAFADILNSSSLQGPNDDFDVTKPDITNPGTNIYAAIGDIAPAGGNAQFGFLSGTSMSSPHTAGSAALIRSAHPTWTPQEVKSAMQLTAKREGLWSDATTPWNPEHVGNGRVDLNKALLSGLVMNETFANFVASNPATGGNPRTLNLPSMRFTNCPGECVWVRTFRNTLGVATTWNAVVDAPPGVSVTVTPSSFSFTGNINETQTVTMSVRLSEAVSTRRYGRVNFVEAADLAPDASLSFGITGTAATTPAPGPSDIFADGFEAAPPQ